MMQMQRALPGPTGTSCLTCKQRHKKCDMRRPICARCEKGGYDCLGYNHNKRGVAPLPSIPKPRPVRRPQNRVGIRSAARATYNPTNSDTDSPGSTSGLSPPILGYEDGNASVSSSSGSSNASPELSVDDTLVNTAPTYDDIIYLDSRRTSTHGHRSLFATGRPPAQHSPLTFQSLRNLFSTYARLPDTPSYLSKAILGSANVEEYVMTHCDRMLEHTYFKPLSRQMTEMQCLITKRLQTSELTRWVMFLCARICESFIKSDTSHNKTYSLWIDQLQQALKASLTGTLDSSEIQERRGDWLEILLLKTMVEHSSNTYQLLRSATPTFLQMAYSEPTLWPTDCDPTCIPLVNVITSSRHEFSFFTLMDTTAAMAFGLPQQVEYDTSMKHLPTSSTAHEWVHSTPMEFQIALAEINACRDKSPNARCWEEIERKLTTWQARLTEVDKSWESWMTIAWFAVQESWRHALLIYLYMSVCGALSDDPRVQASVSQILQVISTVRKRESPDVNVPFFIQYLMAGICARSEKQRSIARENLANVSDTKFWLMRAIDFVPVLDDLWHGAAANGRPIRWSDYLRSREKALPVVV